jgi:hypothetical protein
MSATALHPQARQHLELKTQLRFCPVSLSLSTILAHHNKIINIFMQAKALVLAGTLPERGGGALYS